MFVTKAGRFPFMCVTAGFGRICGGCFFGFEEKRLACLSVFYERK